MRVGTRNNLFLLLGFTKSCYNGAGTKPALSVRGHILLRLHLRRLYPSNWKNEKLLEKGNEQEVQLFSLKKLKKKKSLHLNEAFI